MISFNDTKIKTEYLNQYNKLDSFQKEFIDLNNKVCKVLANAGSGKTHSSIVKVLDYIINKNINPKDILLISYTNKAANLLKERYSNFFKVAIPDDSLESLVFPNISTIHSLCYKLLTTKLKEYDNNSHFTIMNDYKTSKVLKDVLVKVFKEYIDYTDKVDDKLCYAINYIINDIGQSSEFSYFFDLKLNPDFSINTITKGIDYSLTNTSYSINNFKVLNQEIDLDDYQIIQNSKLKYYSKLNTLLKNNKRFCNDRQLELIDKNIINILDSILIDFFIAKLKTRLLSFIDILYISLLYNNQYKSLGNNYKVIIVDEAQDLDYLNFYLFKQLFEYNKESLILIGDPKQSLYSFRSADPNILDKLEYFIPGVQVDVKYLLNNYRSTPKLVEYSNDYSIKEFKEIFDVQPSVSIKEATVSSIFFHQTETMEQEFDYITKDILKNKYNYKDVSILARRNKSLVDLEPYLINNRIPYKIKYDSKSISNQSSFKFLYSVYSILINQKDIEGLCDILEYIKGIGTKTNGKIKDLYLSKLNENNNLTIFDKSSIDLFQNTQIKYVYDNLLLPLFNSFKDSSFRFDSLTKQIHNILLNKFNYIENSEDSINYVSNNNLDVCLQLTEDQIFKACNTMLDIYKSNISNGSFNCLLEIEKFYEIYETLSATQFDKKQNTKDDNCVNLSTIHSFKGLENKIIYYFQTSNIVPFQESAKVDDMCVTYVAVTRAIEKLIITSSTKCRTFDRQEVNSFINPYIKRYLKQ